ncbi:helix-turn-helix domain-containing protein [Amycolatopsis sp.]|uniref:helix-turn-helix domain-containing protein n=1 Tax=Amycolatopsis sp. TaxID=37632 RepID=UPI002B8F6ECB|nr:helix-turn-helix domain-containing protein [Amycolatopsis sp.]HVV13421.1 helix-turn-helix domain-containing protein [Amycolatopsis sp.]
MWERNGVDKLDLLLHPVRLRIVHALSGDRTRTTADLCASLPGVPKTTVYRHVGLLSQAGVLEVAGEQRVHGAVERHYRLRREASRIGRDLAKTMTVEDNRRAFAAGMAVLLADFNAYLDTPDADPFADSAGYTQFPLWLDPDELAELIEQVTAAIAAKRNNAATPGRRPYLLSPIIFPAPGMAPDE